MLLVEKLFRRSSGPELDMKAQKENFERQMLALKSDQTVELSEKDTLLEIEKEQAQLQVEQLKSENEHLQKVLEEERNQKALLEQSKNSTLEKVLQEEQENITVLGELKQELNNLKRELHEEKRRSLALEQRDKENLEQILKDERERAAELQLLEREGFQRQLEEEREKLLQGQQQLARSFIETGCQSPAAMENSFESQFPQIPIHNDHTSTETLYNVLLAEIMSLQLLYQMQDLADSCGHVTMQSRDSGWTECDDEVLENVGFGLLEKGGLILNSLRSVQASDAISVASTESLRDAFMLQFPLSPKASRDFAKSETPGSSPCRVVRDLKTTVLKGSNTTLSSKASSGSSGVVNTGLESASSSSMGSYCDQEPLSPRTRRQTSDSGCSSQHSGSELSPVEQKFNFHKDFTKRVHGSTVCVPLAEEDDDDYLNEVETENNEHFRLLTEKVSTLEKDLVRLKRDLDSETVNFFSTVFLVESSEQHEYSEMRYLFDCVREKLLAEILGQDTNNDSHLELPLPVLEQAVNLLLVNKTVMSCILVLQNRAGAQNKEEELGRLVPEVVQVDQQVQTDEPVKALRRKIRKGLFTCTSKHAGVVTDPEPRSPVHHRECQTSEECLVPRLPTEPVDNIDAHNSPKADNWTDLLPEMTSAESVFSDELLRTPDGESRAGTPVSGSEDNASLAGSTATKSRDDHVIAGSDVASDEESEEKSLKKKKKKRRLRIGLLACLGPVGRKGSKQKTDQAPPNTEREKLVK